MTSIFCPSKLHQKDTSKWCRNLLVLFFCVLTKYWHQIDSDFFCCVHRGFSLVICNVQYKQHHSFFSYIFHLRKTDLSIAHFCAMPQSSKFSWHLPSTVFLKLFEYDFLFAAPLVILICYLNLLSSSFSTFLENF